MEIYIDEVAIAVKDMEAARRFYEGIVGLTPRSDRIILEGTPGTGRMVTYRLGKDELDLNICVPCGPQSVLMNRILQKRGEGILHFRFAVDKIDAIHEKCAAAGIRLVGPYGELIKPGDRVSYTDPHATHGTVIEFLENGVKQEKYAKWLGVQ